MNERGATVGAPAYTWPVESLDALLRCFAGAADQTPKMIEVDGPDEAMVERVFRRKLGSARTVRQTQQQHGAAVRVRTNPLGELVTVHVREIDVDDSDLGIHDVQELEPP